MTEYEVNVMNTINKCVADHFRIAPEDMKRLTRAIEIVCPRQIAMHMMRQKGITLQSIADYYNKKTHVSVWHSIRIVNNSIKCNAEYAANYMSIPLDKSIATRVYIAGKVTGIDRVDYVAKFAEAAKVLEKIGYYPVNPTILVGRHATYQEAMRICIAALVKCDAICVLHDCNDSPGGLIEVSIAKTIGIERIYMSKEFNIFCRENND